MQLNSNHVSGASGTIDTVMKLHRPCDCSCC